MSKIDAVLIENVEDLDVVMTMYSLLEYRKMYSKTYGSLWNYYRDELSDESNGANSLNKNVINSKSFKYKTSITGSTYNVNNNVDGYNANKEDTKKVEISVPLKHLGNFWNSLDIPLVNCEVSLALTWSAACVITSIETRILVGGQLNRDDSPTGATFKITDTKLYVPVVILSAENDNKPLEQLKIGFKRRIKWNKYRSEMSNQARNNKLNYLIDPTFTNVNRLFVLSYENETDRTSFEKYYVPKIEIKEMS